MANFDESMKYVLANEGGFVDDPKDPGGATNYGITLATFSDYLMRQATVDELKNIKMDTVMALYHEFYYSRMNLFFVHNNNVVTAILDMAVNIGCGKCAGLVEKTLTRMLFDYDHDERMGDITTESLNECDPSKFIDLFEQYVMAHYNHLVMVNPKLAKFLNGWSKRSGRLLTLR